MKYSLILLFFFLSTGLFAQQKMVAITIDDLPFVRMGSMNSGLLGIRTLNLLNAMIKYKAPATGFVNMKQVYTHDKLDSIPYYLLKIWLLKGFDHGNHTFSHPDYNHVSYSEFVKDIEKNEPLLNQMLKENNKSMVYFRHPYLHRGNNKAKADSLADYLRKRNYIEAPVTIDNAEWIFAAAYDSVIKTNIDEQRIAVGKEYISYMESKLRYYERQSEKLFGRNIRQILLIHANSLNSDYMGDLLQMFMKNGYSFINLETALEDELYQTEDHYYKNGGISWLDRWAITQGKSKDFFAGEPVCPAHIMKLAKVNSE
jgi:peptidoglycan/xylan/chitin deacetylase (PgdA/CDA1 family)